MKKQLITLFINKSKQIFSISLSGIKTLFVLIILSGGILLGSCKKFLNTTPTDFILTNTFYESKAQFTNALAAIYGPLSGNNMYGGFFCTQAQPCTDECYCWNTAIGSPVTYNSLNYTNSSLNSFWQTAYAAIQKANLIIANKGNAVNITDTALAEIVGEAKFLRAWYYFLLVQNFGDIPMRLTPTAGLNNLNIARTPTKDVYAQIVKDMTEAEAVLYLPSNPELANASSRVSKLTAEGVLARVCLFMAGYPLNDQTQYANALMWAKKVQAMGINNLTTNADTLVNVVNLRNMPLAYTATLGNPAYINNGYAQAFVNEATGVYNVKEMMWEADAGFLNPSVAVGGILGSQIGIQCTNDFVLGKCGPSTSPQQYLWNLFGSGDLRRDWAIGSYTYNGLTVASRVFYNAIPGPLLNVLYRPVGKWRREYEPIRGVDKSGWGTTLKYPLLRYSDVLLMLAEAEFMVNGPTQTGLDAINQVRRRGYGLNINIPAPTIDFTVATFTLSAIQDERARELCFESLRKNDLIRWGIYLQRCQQAINYNNTNGYPKGLVSIANLSFINALAGGKQFLLWPIPSSEVLVNNLIVQNPGW